MSGIKVPSEPTPRPALEDDPEGRLILDVILDTRAKQEEIKVKMEEAKLALESLEKVKANGSPLNAEGQSNYETLLRLIRLIDTALPDYDKNTAMAREKLKKEVEAFNANEVIVTLRKFKADMELAGMGLPTRLQSLAGEDEKAVRK